MLDEQLRAMFDTNTYEFLLEKELPQILWLVESGNLVVYGCSVIRDELRKIPKNAKFEGKSYRSTMLNLYDKLVKRHSVPMDKVAETLANGHLAEYKGGTARHKLNSDFLIVAVATLKNLNIVVSEDNKTLKSRFALLAYNKVNSKNGLSTPRFLSVKELIKL